MKKIFAWTVILALFALTACSGKKTNAAQKTHADATPDALIEAAEGNDSAEAHQPTVSEESAEDFDSFIKDKTYLPVEYLAALKGEDRNILLKYNPQIESNSQYHFADERDTEWYENGTFRYMQFFMPMDLFLGNSFFIKIYESQRETSGYIIKGKQTDYSKKSFKGNEPCLVDLSPLENFDADDVLRIEIDGDYITCSVANRKFSHKYFLADKETYNQIKLLLTTNACDLSKVTWPRHADEGGNATASENANKEKLADALIAATENNNAAEVQRLIADGADVNAQDYDGMTALMAAAWANSVDIAKLLLAAGADMNAKDYDLGRTALMYAAQANSTDVAKLLLAAGADIEAKGNSGGTALMWAAQRNSIDVARLLIAAGADVNAKYRSGGTALMVAAQHNAADIAKLLVDAGANVNANANDGKTALMAAAAGNLADVAKLLLAAGADVNAKDNYGGTALMTAAYWNASDVAKLLIDAGADMNAKTNGGITALMETTYRDAAGVAELLIEAGADVNAKDNEGKTALMWAADNGATNVAELLKAAGAQ